MSHPQDNELAHTAATAREALRKINRVLSDTSTDKDVNVVVEQSDDVIRVPREVATALREILVNSVAGRSVGVIPMRAELTTQQAANLLNVSRPHVIKLMNEGILPGHKVAPIGVSILLMCRPINTNEILIPARPQTISQRFLRRWGFTNKWLYRYP
ncbi:MULTISPECIES: helix-turn-helix domain-containing protein [Corynebacterium]|nr:hypothetical protein A3654_00745 [Corynebacterium glutamicum]AST19420.1 DNA-binding protein [Corynebacterium glutamicum ATCC 14067]QJS17389.1 helix-turn-helix domain-containing protein [Corynebacterium glutamicum]QXU45906.1 helix-turn-helix domain-containing protein [[Brevibacterium] flavum]